MYLAKIYWEWFRNNDNSLLEPKWCWCKDNLLPEPKLGWCNDN